MKEKRLEIRLTDYVYKKLEIKAKEKQISKSEYLRELLNEAIKDLT